MIGFLGYRQWAGSGPEPITATDVDRAVKQGIERALQQEHNAPPAAAAAYQKIYPSLVTVTIEAAQAASPGASAAPDPSASGSPAPGASPSTPAPSAPSGPSASASPSAPPSPVSLTELGAGVVINAQGAVLTALHVAEAGAQPGRRIRVRFADGTVGTASIATRQVADDIAILAVDTLPQVVVPAVMGGGAQVGDAVFPVGNPLGLEFSLTAGVVSATGRSIRTEAGGTLNNLIQFDAAVNPGNSGGPLLDRAGQVIGVVTGLANPSSQKYFVGVGFAVPIATAGGAAGMPQR